MAKKDKIRLFEIDELVNKYRGSYYLELAFKNSKYMKELGLDDLAGTFEEARLFELNKRINHFISSNKQEEKISKEETFTSLFDEMIIPDFKEGKKIA